MDHLKYGTRVKLLTLKDSFGNTLSGTVVAWNKHHDGITAPDHYDYNILIDSYQYSYWDKDTNKQRIVDQPPPQKIRYEWVTLAQMEVIDELPDIMGVLNGMIDAYAQSVDDYNKGGGYVAQMDRVHSSDALSKFMLDNRHRIKLT